MNKIESMLPPPHIFEDSYKMFVEKGKDHIRKKKVVISMLTRNSEDYLEANIDKLMSFFEKYEAEASIVLYENDSKDGTKQIIEQLLAKYPLKIFAQTEVLNRIHYKATKEKERTEALAEYRNINLDFIRNNLSDHEYTVVCDSDFLDFSENGILHSFGILSYTDRLTAVCGNSYEIKFHNGQAKLWNYDCWAFRHTWWYDLQDIQNSYLPDNKMMWFGFWFPPVGSEPLQVNSGFGGMTIYQTQQYITGTYNGMDCEHVLFNWSLYGHNKDFCLALNPSMVMLLR